MYLVKLSRQPTRSNLDMTAFDTTRRHLLKGLVFTTLSYLAQDYLSIAPALAGDIAFSDSTDFKEIYHVFVPYVPARRGGKQTLTLRSGGKTQIKIPSRTEEGRELVLSNAGLEGNDITIVCHTLYDREIRIADRIYEEIENTSFVQDASKAKCKMVYEQIEEARYISDLTALGLLDYVIESSKLEDEVKERYSLASTNSRLLGIQQEIEATLESSKLSNKDKEMLLGTFAYVRAGDPIPDFKALNDLDSIVATSTLPSELKEFYTISSAKSRGVTVDIIIIDPIASTSSLSELEKQYYLMIYQEVRDGKPISNEEALPDIDSLILNSKIPQNAKAVYAFTRKGNVSDGQDLAENILSFLQDVQDIQDLKDDIDDTYAAGANIVPQATRLLSSVGAETATGVSLSSLSGAAATNATLAALGGGSVAAGGLGMLGGLAVATGGAALIGAAGLVSIALVSEMDAEDRWNLGISVGSGTLAGAASVLAAWTAASTLGVAGSVSGAAAISATLSALGGLSVLTGGAALVASGTAFLIWSFLKGHKKRDKGTLKQLETRIYTPTENPERGSLGEFLALNVDSEYTYDEGFSAPNIPLDKLSNALSSWLCVYPNEQILAFVDTSLWDDGKEGVAFTEERVIWKNSGTFDYMTYDRLSSLFDSGVSQMLSSDNNRHALHRVLEISEILDNSDEDRWIELLEEIGNTYSVAS